MKSTLGQDLAESANAHPGTWDGRGHTTQWQRGGRQWLPAEALSQAEGSRGVSTARSGDADERITTAGERSLGTSPSGTTDTDTCRDKWFTCTHPCATHSAGHGGLASPALHSECHCIDVVGVGTTWAVRMIQVSNAENIYLVLAGYVTMRLISCPCQMD